MTDDRWYVEIVNRKTKEVEQRMGPDPLGRAERIKRGAEINLDHKRYRVRLAKQQDSLEL